MRRNGGPAATIPTTALLLALGLTLTATKASAQEFTPGVTGWGGAIGTWQTYQAGMAGQGFAQLGVEARALFAGVVAVDGWWNSGLALNNAGARSGHTFALRCGVSFPGVTVLVGPLVQTAPDSPAQASLLPSISATFGTKQLRGVVGVFDHLGVAPLRLGAEFEAAGFTFGAAYVPLIGLELLAKRALGTEFAIEARAMTNLILYSGTANLVIGFHWTPGSAPAAK